MTTEPRSADPLWTRIAFFGLLAATAIAYAWHLGDSGWANSYYAAAVQAGTKSWKAMLFGSTDASNFITVDKSPASLWPMEIMARIFGMNSWSMLLPQAIEGVAAVAILHATIRRWFGTVAGLIAALVMAATPVAAMMFRFNNPDALLTLLLIASAYFLTRAIEDGATKWMVACGALVGFAFLAKELQAFLVLPAFAVAYLWSGPGRIGRRIAQGVAMALAMCVSAGWWIAALMLTPASSRPYVGGSQNNSFWNVLFGYNGFGRLNGEETGSVVAGGGQGQPGNWGTTGPGRMFRDQWATQISWLLPTALALLAIGLGYSLLKSRTDKTRAALIIWGGWLLVTGLAFSYGQGIIHEYYAIALAPAIGAVIGIGTTVLWQARATWLARGLAAAVLLLTAWWTQHLMDRTVNWFSSLHGWFIPVACLLGVAFVASGAWLRRALPVVSVASLAVTMFAPVAATATTVRTPHTGPIPIAGPASTGGRFPGGGPGGFRGGGPGGVPNFGGGGPGGLPGGLPGGFPGGVPNFGGGLPGGLPGGFPGGGPGGQPGGVANFGGGRGGGLLSAAVPGKTLTAMLRSGGRGYRWAAASVGAMTAAGYQLASDQPVMALGGFNGNDPAPSLRQFQEYVADHKVHYFIGGGGFGGFGGGGFGGGGNGGAQTKNPIQEISTWVTSNFAAKTVDGITVYDLSQPPTPQTSADVRGD